ncbi:hypothetical protein [Peptococcus simiae]|uniref:hypothetical protein n=1 Tax=Peptococcus simiae TaxID=1643805 RepID=UPI0039816029
MTERAERYLKRYPESEYLYVEDQEGDSERAQLFSELTEEEARYVLRKQGASEEEISIAFD